MDIVKQLDKLAEEDFIRLQEKFTQEVIAGTDFGSIRPVEPLIAHLVVIKWWEYVRNN